jgi:hypothetical protein
MPDDIATRAHLMFVVGPFVAVALVPLVAWLWRRVLRLDSGASAGQALGLGLWALGMAAVTLEIGQWVAELRAGVEVRGELLAFVPETTTLPRRGQGIATERRVTTLSPRVAFSTPDGRRHVVDGLGGSLSWLAPGDPVTVRYHPADPGDAVPVDFQNEFGALGLFGTLTIVALMAAVYLALVAVQELRQARAGPVTAPAGSRWRTWRDGPGQRWRSSWFRAGVGSLVLALAAPFVIGLREDANLLRAFALALAGVALALACFGLAAALKRGADSALVLYGRSIGVVGFGLFAAWLWALGTG